MTISPMEDSGMGQKYCAGAQTKVPRSATSRSWNSAGHSISNTADFYPALLAWGTLIGSPWSLFKGLFLSKSTGVRIMKTKIGQDKDAMAALAALAALLLIAIGVSMTSPNPSQNSAPVSSTSTQSTTK
jgi:hypothetical protein